MRPLRSSLLAGLGAAALLGGCGTWAGGDSTSTVTVTQTPTREQRELTAGELTRALPGGDEIPSHFATDPGGRDPKATSTSTADPTTCLAMELDTPQMRTFRREHTRAAHAVRYSARSGSSGLGVLTVEMWTHDEFYPKDFLDQAGAAVADCSSYTLESAPGRTSGPWRATTTPIPLLGDQSLGIRIGDPLHDIAVDHLWVASGHNLLHVSMVTGYRDDNEDLLESTAEGVLEDLRR